MKKKLFTSLTTAFASLSSLLPGKRKWLALTTGALLLTAAIVGGLWHSDGGYTALFGSQQHLPLSQIITVLDGEKIAYRIDPNSGQILVPESQLSRIRMTLAGKGIQAISPAGYELMDKDEVLGSSQFVQNIRYKRSLEGEMAQSIMSLDAVETARVHLALDEESAFVLSDKPQNSASVMVRLHYGSRLSREQVNAIIHLVSGSVPGLDPAQVSIVDQAGDLLSEGVADGARTSTSTRKEQELLNGIQEKTRASLANVLTTLVGKNNFRISVMPELDLSLVEETRERFGDTPKVSREQSSEDKSSDRLAIGIPGSLSNRPPQPAPAQPADATTEKTPATLSAHTESQRDYSYDRTVAHIQHPGFELKRLNVAVVLNQDATAVKTWKAEQTAQVTAMLSNAAGIDERRGDRLSLSLMQFVPEAKAVPPAVKWWQNSDILAWCRLGGTGMLLLLALLLVVRPLVKHLIATRKAQPEPVVATGSREATLSATLDDDERRGVELPSFSGDDALPAQSSGLETKLEFLKKLAISDTDRVAEVIRQWITSNERIDSK
ncbi:flagellar basal-body MS-ring/collar protein FliF [Pseudescherichia sp.]|uniref:flagellar basal-body MS-ring/collar protein FliF n=1 Tax=Pseudescherichia sp. TaxID=2055881 RepID=UPI00289FEE8B|nr:flagellar basal-body MS-ring/collar protein FliF [Pseudescherichia sp.]